MKQRSSSLFATWSFLSLYAAAGLCTAGPLLQHGAPSPDLAHHQSQGRQAQSSPNQPQLRAPAQDEALSPFGLASRSQVQRPDPQHPNPSQKLARRRFAASRRANTGVCTFTVSQAQVCNSTELASYLQINTLYSPYSAVDGNSDNIRYQKPIAEYNSYQGLLADVSSLDDDSHTLTITEGDEGDLLFSYGSEVWTEETRAEHDGAGWCEVAGWDEGGEDWSCPYGDTGAERKRTVHCGFPCARIERLELK